MPRKPLESRVVSLLELSAAGGQKTFFAGRAITEGAGRGVPAFQSGTWNKKAIIYNTLKLTKINKLPLGFCTYSIVPSIYLLFNGPEAFVNSLPAKKFIS